MSFFDESVETAKTVFDSAVRYTSDVVGVQKLKIEITKVNSRLTSAYSRLGRIYYSELNDIEIDTEKRDELLAVIKSLQEKLKMLKEELFNARKKKICRTCGRANENDAEFCSRCGEAL